MNFESGMYIESWMNGGKGNSMPTFCVPNYKFDSINVRDITLNGLFSWTETKDHSKWSISIDVPYYFCIGDINRQYSQSSRGGGAICSYNKSVWNSFSGIISQNDTCS